MRRRFARIARVGLLLPAIFVQEKRQTLRSVDTTVKIFNNIDMHTQDFKKLIIINCRRKLHPDGYRTYVLYYCTRTVQYCTRAAQYSTSTPHVQYLVLVRLRKEDQRTKEPIYWSRDTSLLYGTCFVPLTHGSTQLGSKQKEVGRGVVARWYIDIEHLLHIRVACDPHQDSGS